MNFNIPKGSFKKPNKKAQNHQDVVKIVDKFAVSEGVIIGDDNEMSLNPASNAELSRQKKSKNTDNDVKPGVEREGRLLPSGIQANTYFKKVDPKRTRVWPENTRYGATDINNELVSDIRACGTNNIAVLLRPIHDDPEHDYELIYGTQRRGACIEAGKLLYAEIAPIEDADAYILMLSENIRENPSNWAELRSYANGLAKGFFANQNALAEHLNVKRQYVSSLLAFMDLPEWFRVKLEHDIPKASRQFIKNIGRVWRSGLKIQGLGQSEAEALLKEHYDSVQKIQSKLTATKVERLLETIFAIESEQVKSNTFLINGVNVHVNRSRTGGLNISVPAQVGEEFKTAMLSLIGKYREN